LLGSLSYVVISGASAVNGNDVPIRIAIIGCGNVGTAHTRTIRGYQKDLEHPPGLRGIARNAWQRVHQLREARRGPEPPGIPGVELVAAVDSDESRARRLSEAFDVPLVHTDYRAVLDDRDVDAVLVCTPPHLHMEMVVDSAAAGKHIFCEKPLALTSQACDLMIAATERSGVVLQGGCVFRFSSDRGALRAAVLSGELGRPVVWREINNLRAGPVQPWVHDVEMGGGLLWEDSHPLDLMIATLGDPVSVHAVAERFKPGTTTAPDMVVATIRFQEELLHFFECVTPVTGPRVDGVEARRVIWLLEGILRSAHGGEVCHFDGGRPIAL
jgi:predicted dehydrogenase